MVLCYSSSSMKYDQTSHPSLPTCISEPSEPMVTSSVHRFSFLGAILVATNHCIQGTSCMKNCCFGNALTHSFDHYNLASFRFSCLPIFPASNVTNELFTCYQSYLLILPFDWCFCNKIINIIHFTHQWFSCCG